MISCYSLPDVVRICLPIESLCRRSVQNMGVEEEDMLLGLRPGDDTNKDQ
jgi:hypothetical protein